MRAATRRAYSARQLLMLQNPHRHRSGGRPEACGAWLRFPQTIEAGQQCRRTVPRRDNISPAPAITTRSHENNSPSTAPPAALPRKTRPASTKTPNVGCCERAGRTVSRFRDDTAPQGELFRAQMKPPPPLLARSRVRMKPATPLLAHNAAQTHISSEQR